MIRLGTPICSRMASRIDEDEEAAGVDAVDLAEVAGEIAGAGL